MYHSQMTPVRFATYARKLVDRLKTPTLSGIVISGSYARGEAGPYSDLDLWCFYHKEVVKPCYLPQLPSVNVHLRSMTTEEFKQRVSGEREVVAPFFEQLVLFGDTPFLLPKKDTIRLGRRSILNKIENRLQSLPSKEERYDVLNDVMYLLRIERFLACQEYPLTLSDLYAAEEGENRKLIECFSTCLVGEEKRDDYFHLLQEFIAKRR